MRAGSRCWSAVRRSAERSGNADEERVRRLDLAVPSSVITPGGRRDADRGERGRRRRPLSPMHEEQQQRHDHDPAADAEERAEEARDEPDQDEAHGPMLRGVGESDALLERVRGAGGSGDLPRLRRRARADRRRGRRTRTVPGETRAELARLAGRYALVAVISGRAGADVAERVGVDGIRLRRLARARARSGGGALARSISRTSRRRAWPRERAKGCVSFHFRDATIERRGSNWTRRGARATRAWSRASDERCWRCCRRSARTRARQSACLLAGARCTRALYAGDDATDLDAFRGSTSIEPPWGRRDRPRSRRPSCASRRRRASTARGFLGLLRLL